MHKYRVNEKDLCFNCKILTNTNQRFLYYKYHLYDLQGWEKGTTLIQQECWNCTWINAWREFKWIFILPQEPGIFIFQKLMWSYQCRDTHSPGFSRNISVPDSTGRSCFMPHKSNTEFPFKTVYFLGVRGYPTSKYRVIRNDCRGFNNLSYTIHLR